MKWIAGACSRRLHGAPHSMQLFPCDWLRDLLRQVMPPWWRDLDQSHAWDLSYYLTNVYLRTDTAVSSAASFERRP